MCFLHIPTIAEHLLKYSEEIIVFYYGMLLFCLKTKSPAITVLKMLLIHFKITFISNELQNYTSPKDHMRF